MLTNGQSVTLNGAGGTSQYFAVDIPEAATNLTVETTGGTGDADLYVRMGMLPSDTAYTCRPYQSGNEEKCILNVPVPGRYFIRLRATQPFTGVTLKASWTTVPVNPLANNIPVTFSGRVGSFTYAKIEVPQGASSLTVTTGNGTGDVDIYEQYLALPTRELYAAKSTTPGNAETITITNPQPGTHWILLFGFDHYYSADLTASWK